MAATTVPSAEFPARKQNRPPALPLTQVEADSPFQRLGLNVLLVFLFLVFSRIFDVKFGNLHITGLTYRVALVMALLSGGFKIALNTKIGRAMLGFTICFGLSVPFSIWKGGSVPVFINEWLMYSFSAFLATAGLIGNYAQTRKAITALTWALFVFVIIANVFGTAPGGRLILTQGKFANSNEMAQVLLIGMPLWGIKLSEPGVKKLFAFGVIVLMLMTVLRTGSRGALVAFAVMLLFIFLRASMAMKVQMAVALVVLGAIVTVTMPETLIARYKTIAEDVDDEDMDARMRDAAVGSTESRKALLQNSIKFTFQHPLLGVGPGMFAVAENEEAQAQGARKGQWLGTHNSYTQVSSELGVPAFCFFVAAVVMSLRGPYQIYKKTRDHAGTSDIARVALGLHYAMIIYAVTILFEHIAYSSMLPVFGGLVSALMRTVDAEIEKRRHSPPPPVITAPHFRTYSPGTSV